MCAQGNRCKESINHCPYTVSYVSSETSTTGFLLEDILKLKTEDIDQELVEAHVIFGCGQVQTGSFLDVAAPNGLFGLGLEKISVPSILSTQGYIADSFSMCFGNDGTGRISLGDKGSSNLEETPFNVNPLRPTYNITITQMRVGTTLVDLEITALFDSGTSFTYLVDPAYTKFTESFHSQVQDRRRPLDPKIPFEYCCDMRETLALGWEKSSCYDNEDSNVVLAKFHNSSTVPPTVVAELGNHPNSDASPSWQVTLGILLPLASQLSW